MHFKRHTITFAVSTILFCSIPLPSNAANSVATSDAETIAAARALADNQKFDESMILTKGLAEKGFAPAQNLMGDLVKVGGDSPGAVDWYKKAAEQGDARAQNNLGRCYATGDGVTADDKIAVQWLTKAAEKGHAKGMNNLAVMYSQGRGVLRDQTIAKMWRLKAAEAGDPAAQHNVAYFCILDNKDYPQALKWWRRAAEQNFANAEYGIAEAYINGFGVEKDAAEADKWYRRAALHGMMPAVLRIMSLKPTPDQIAHGLLFIEKDRTMVLEFDCKDGKLLNPRATEVTLAPGQQPPSKPDTVTLQMIVEPDTKETFLHVHNNCSLPIDYDCMERKEFLGYEPTSVLTVSPQAFVIEHWPREIEQLMLKDFRVATK